MSHIPESIKHHLVNTVSRAHLCLEDDLSLIVTAERAKHRLSQSGQST